MKLLHVDNQITFSIADKEAMIHAAKRLCHDVYFEAGYIKRPFANGVIPHDHDEDSIYIIASTPSDQIIGTIRMTIGYCKTLEAWKGNLFPESEQMIASIMNQGAAYEVGALAVRKDYRRSKVSWGLYKSALLSSLAHELEYAIVGLDERALRALELLGWHVIRIGKPKKYLGSITVPGIIQVSQQPTKIKKKNLNYHRYLAA